MAGNIISAPTLIVNNETVAIVPNTLVYDAGEGEVSVRAASTGGGGTEPVAGVNAESMIGKVKFDIFLTAETDTKIADWKNRTLQNSIEFTQAIGSTGYVSRAFDQMSLVNNVERNASPDGVVSLEWEGGQMTST